MESLGGLLLLFAVLYLLSRSRRSRRLEESTVSSVLEVSKLPYKKRDYFFSRAERSFYEVLCLVVRDMDVHVFAKVRMADLFYIPKGTASWKTHWNRIQSKHVDFVICDRVQIRPLCVIELDDSSHTKESRIKRDQFVEEVYQDAGLPLLRFPVKQAYVTSDIAAQIKQVLEQKVAGKQAAVAP